MKLIDQQLDEAVLTKKQKGSLGMKESVIYAIREGKHVILDLSRKAYTELLLDITSKIFC